MNSALQNLARLVAPPAEAVSPGTEEGWIEVEKQIGSPLPTDFKEYVSLYGAGQWVEFFGIVNPFYKWKHPQASKSWKEWHELRFQMYEKFQRDFPKDIATFPLFPKPGGLLACGYDDNGGTISWLTTGDPDTWPIVYLDDGLSKEYDVYEMTLTGFLEALFSGKILPKSYPEDFLPSERPTFHPYTTE